MTTWEKNNNKYLDVAVAWVRARLEKLCDGKTDITKQEQAYFTFLEEQPSPALVQMGHKFRLTSFEQHILLLTAAQELDTRISQLCARAQDHAGKPFPTFGLAMAMFEDATWDAIAPDAPLRYWELIKIDIEASKTLMQAPLIANERIVSYIKGLNYLDKYLSACCSSLDNEWVPPLSVNQQRAVVGLVEKLRAFPPSESLPLIQLLGDDSSSKKQVAQAIARDLGLQLYQFPMHQIPSLPCDMKRFAMRWERESSLLPLALILDAQDWQSQDNRLLADGLSALTGHNNGLIFLQKREAWGSDSGATLLMDVEKPETEEQVAIWTDEIERKFGNSDPVLDELPQKIANQFNLSIPGIYQILNLCESPAEIWEVCMQQTRPQFGALAQEFKPKAHWDDLILPEPQQRQLALIANQVTQRLHVYHTWGLGHTMNRGLGVSVLFAGESGTGKTMAAEVLANELGLDLYRIDLSAVVNKYIGETEKNLRKLFEAAENSGAILFFDEADALFGKRSEVKDSHDRFANIEINYLLQRMEAYRGLAILASNMKNALDNAFLRRLRFIVEFPFPGQAERKKIWQKAFAHQIPGASTLDYNRLARFNLSGGSIHTISINAAFSAAGTPHKTLTMPLVLEMIEIEMKKMQAPVNQTLLHWPSNNGVGS